MNSPYQILGVSEQASDADIQQAYLQAVKEHPPERDPPRFRQIQQAFELIKDEDSRLRYALFHVPNVEFDALLDRAFGQDGPMRPLPADDFLKLLGTISIDKMPAKFKQKPS